MSWRIDFHLLPIGDEKWQWYQRTPLGRRFLKILSVRRSFDFHLAARGREAGNRPKGLWSA